MLRETRDARIGTTRVAKLRHVTNVSQVLSRICHFWQVRVSSLRALLAAAGDAAVPKDTQELVEENGTYKFDLWLPIDPLTDYEGQKAYGTTDGSYHNVGSVQSGFTWLEDELI